MGAYGHEELDARRFAEWGFDFLKYDWCSYGEKAKDNSLAELQKPYRLMGRSLRRQNRDMVLNLCQYGMGNVWTWGKEVGGHSWRTAGDLGGCFKAFLPPCSATALMSMPAANCTSSAGRAHGTIPTICCWVT